MFTTYAVVTLLATAANGFSGIVAMLHWKMILPSMAKAGVPESWLTFPIGVIKTAGAAGLLLGLIGVPLIGTAAAVVLKSARVQAPRWFGPANPRLEC